MASSRCKSLIAFLCSNQIKKISEELQLGHEELVGLICFIWNGTFQATPQIQLVIKKLIDIGLHEIPTPRHGFVSGGVGGGVSSSFLKELEIQEETTKEEENPIVPLKKKTEIENCKVTWISTLKHFSIHRNVSMMEETEIARSVMYFGYELTRLALFGARFEASSEGFNPANHVRISRVLSRERIDKFANLGAQEQERVRKLSSSKRSEQSPVDAFLNGVDHV